MQIFQVLITQLPMTAFRVHIEKNLLLVLFRRPVSGVTDVKLTQKLNQTQLLRRPYVGLALGTIVRCDERWMFTYDGVQRCQRFAVKRRQSLRQLTRAYV